MEVKFLVKSVVALSFIEFPSIVIKGILPIFALFLSLPKLQT
jgi:hypothetical protein